MSPGVRRCLVRDCPTTLAAGGGLCGFHRDSWERQRTRLEWQAGKQLPPWKIVLAFERWLWRSHRELIRDR